MYKTEVVYQTDAKCDQLLGAGWRVLSALEVEGATRLVLAPPPVYEYHSVPLTWNTGGYDPRSQAAVKNLGNNGWQFKSSKFLGKDFEVEGSKVTITELALFVREKRYSNG